MSNRDLKRRIVSAVAWTGTDAIARIGLQFAITVVLARILTPDDFGVIGLVSLFMAVSYILADSSLSAGLIQRKTITSDDSLSVLVVNFSLSLFLGALLCSIAQSFAEFFARPVLAQLTFLLAATLVVTSVSSVPRALLTRDLKFRSIALSSVVANSLAGMVAIGLAYAGFGVWSLAVQGFIAACVSTIMLWISCGTLRGARFRVSSIRSLASFGVYLMASDLLVTISTRLHTLLIGKMYSTSDLGFYMRAENVQHLPVSLITKVISKVAFPIFSRHQDQRDVLAAGVKKASSVVMVLNAPIMVGIAVSAESLVYTVFGQQWMASVPYIQILCLGGLFWPLQYINVSVLRAQGLARQAFHLELLIRMTSVSLIVLASFYGLAAIAVSVSIGQVISFLVTSQYTGRRTGAGPISQLINILPHLGVSGLMGAALLGLQEVVSMPKPVELFVQLFLGVFVFVIVSKVLRIEGLDEAVEYISTRFAESRKLKSGASR